MPATTEGDQQPEVCNDVEVQPSNVQGQLSDDAHLVQLCTPAAQPAQPPWSSKKQRCVLRVASLLRWSHNAPRRQVTFAPGPLDTDDGHPHHTGRMSKARVVQPLYEGEPLTRRNIAALEAELGPVNQPSIERLKRRCGVMVEHSLHCVPTPTPQGWPNTDDQARAAICHRGGH